MPVITHNAVTAKTHRKLLDGLGQNLFKGDKIIRVLEYLQPAVGAVQNVINNISFGYSFGSWHDRQYTPSLLACQLKSVSDPLRFSCAQAARVHDKLPRQMSFTAGCNVLLSQWLMPPDESLRQALGQHNLFQIACNEVADRPGRIEPRVVKRRPKEYPLMTKPRNQYKQEKTQNTTIAGKRGLKA
jgi:hypothetical protein